MIEIIPDRIWDELEEKCGEMLFFKQGCCQEKKENECCEGGVCRKEDK